MTSRRSSGPPPTTCVSRVAPRSAPVDAPSPLHRATTAANSSDGTTWFDASSAAVRAARTLVVDHLSDWAVDADTVSDAALLVSELVTNVVTHTDSRSVGVHVTATPDRIAVAVREQRARELERPSQVIPDGLEEPASASAIHGRGMKILEALAAEWGISRAHRTTSTWFTLAPARRLPLEAVDPESASLLRDLADAFDRTTLLLDITRGLAAAGGPTAVSDVITRYLRQHFAACFVGIALVDEPPSTMRYVSLSPLPLATRREWSAFEHDGRSPVSAAVRHRTEYVHHDRESADAEFPGIARHMDTAGVHGMVHLPLLTGGDCIGALAVCWDAPLELVDADLDLLKVVAGYAAQALRLHPVDRPTPR